MARKMKGLVALLMALAMIIATSPREALALTAIPGSIVGRGSRTEAAVMACGYDWDLDLPSEVQSWLFNSTNDGGNGTASNPNYADFARFRNTVKESIVQGSYYSTADGALYVALVDGARSDIQSALDYYQQQQGGGSSGGGSTNTGGSITLNGDVASFTVLNYVTRDRGNGWYDASNHWHCYYFSNVYTLPVDMTFTLPLPSGFMADYADYDLLVRSSGQSDNPNAARQVTVTYLLMPANSYTANRVTTQIYDTTNRTFVNKEYVSRVTMNETNGGTLITAKYDYVYTEDGVVFSNVTNVSVNTFTDYSVTVPTSVSGIMPLHFEQPELPEQPTGPQITVPEVPDEPTGPDTSGNATLDDILAQINEFEGLFWRFYSDVVGMWSSLWEMLDYWLESIEYNTRTTYVWLQSIFYKLDNISNEISDVNSYYIPVVNDGNTVQQQLAEDAQELKSKFPLSVPWDLYLLLKVLEAPPHSMVFDVPIAYFGDTQIVHVDLSGYQAFYSTMRTLSLWAFAWWLLCNTRNVLINDFGG